ncbi:unnamed protein product, partial [Oppiella nova]
MQAAYPDEHKYTYFNDESDIISVHQSSTGSLAIGTSGINITCEEACKAGYSSCSAHCADVTTLLASVNISKACNFYGGFDHKDQAKFKIYMQQHEEIKAECRIGVSMGTPPAYQHVVHHRNLPYLHRQAFVKQPVQRVMAYSICHKPKLSPNNIPNNRLNIDIIAVMDEY